MQDMPNHILDYHLSTPENVDVVQVTNVTENTMCLRNTNAPDNDQFQRWSRSKGKYPNTSSDMKALIFII